MQNENENDKKYGHRVSGGVIVSLIMAIGLLFLVGDLSTNGEGRVNIPFSEEAQDCQASEERMDSLEILLHDYLENVDGKWNIYVKDLRHGLTMSMNDEPMYAASLIKLYVMESTYANMDRVLANASMIYGEQEAQTIIDSLLENMIVRSDNESFNELVRMHSPLHSFTEGCAVVNAYLSQQDYNDTVVVHTLHPAESPAESASEDPSVLNETSSMDCGLLLERIYNNECVSYAASEAMLELLSMQEIDTKIPAGTAREIKIANKTGETDKQQHDVAIVYTKDRDYILCIMTTDLTAEDEDASIENVKAVANLVENTLIQR
ncbi:MAG: serine hydrolase [Peptococcaceae bacterium]|nr:serine hydrolase [Peptococcaceae bacterium]